MPREPIAVLLMAYGGPESLTQVEPYIMDIRGGRPLPSQSLEEIRQRYAKIGGKSPLLKITRAQAKAVEEELTRQGIPNKTFVGMRHWRPFIREAVDEIKVAGLTRVVALCLAPQYSHMSVGAYFKQYQAALKELDLKWETIYIKSWHSQPQLLQAFAEKAKKALSNFPDGLRDQVVTIFTAHSLPEKILESNDPYDYEVKTTAAGVAGLLGIPLWIFAYQSQGCSQDQWLGPRVEEVLTQLASAGTKNVLIVPVGFVSDHVEILYDVDICFRNLAVSLGMRLERPESLNTNRVFIKSIASTIRTHLQNGE